MQSISYEAFLDELEKIAAIQQALGRAALSGRRVVGKGLTSPSHIARRARRLEEASAFRAAREERRHAELMDLIQKGEFDPKRHSMITFMRFGKVVPRPVAAPVKPPTGGTITSSGITRPRRQITVVMTPRSVAAPATSERIPLTPRQKARVLFSSLGGLGVAGGTGYHARGAVD